MTATDELRKLLDERGAEWKAYDEFELTTQWETHNGAFVYWARERDGLLLVESTAPTKCSLSVTPTQAIAATLGAGTCHTVAMDCFGNPPYNTTGLNGNSTACGCSECGAPWSTVGLFRGNQLRHNFKACPICGRKVVVV